MLQHDRSTLETRETFAQTDSSDLIAPLPDHLNTSFKDEKECVLKTEQCNRVVALRLARVAELLAEVKRVETAKKEMETLHYAEMVASLKATGETEQAKDQTGQPCVVCMEEAKTILLMPCRHLCLCALCAKELHSCPLCRSKIKKRISVYV